MHSIAKIFDIIKYLKKSKNQKLKKMKRERIGKMAQKGKKSQFFFHESNPQNKTKKMSAAKLNSVQWLERYSL